MNTENLTLNTLFAQLGLDDTDRGIHYFLRVHSPLPEHVVLHKANIWNCSQALFLKQAIADDAEWCYLADRLDSLLREVHPFQ